MRKLAPVFFSSIIVLASGSALALGDMHKNKKAPSTDNTSQTYTTPSNNSSNTGTNSSAVAPSPGSSTNESINSDSTSSGTADSSSSMPSSGTSKAQKPGNSKSTPDAKIQRDNNDETNTPSTPSKMIGTPAQRSGFIKTNYGGDKGTVSSEDNSGSTKKKQIARNDDRCDQSKHKTLPKDCVAHTGTGAAASNGMQGQSGGASGSVLGGSSGSGSAAGAGSSASGSAGAAGGSSSGSAGSAGGSASGSAGAGGSASGGSSGSGGGGM